MRITTEIETITHREFKTTYTMTTVSIVMSYAECARDKVVSSYRKHIINGSPDTDDALDLYSCCVQCFQINNCTGSTYAVVIDYDYSSPDDTENCSLFLVDIGGQCNPSEIAG